MADKIPLYYTFGNHMHWVDMEWLWGYHVLSGSVRDMLRFCSETGAKGCINFDGIGYEKLAAEDPEALVELRTAVQKGLIEPVGCSYGQPYGLFHGGESNVRQRIYGTRTVFRLLGKRPRTFWEEEFDFFPQLPQMLKGVGFKGASLYFQWTWHTPEIPVESEPVVRWVGMDGTSIKTATRNRFNLHQWPEDFQLLLNDIAKSDSSELQTPFVQQWLELMRSPDWMCRSELMVPMLQKLKEDNRFDLQFVTLGEHLESKPDDLPTRNYKLDDVWHGMALGKNGDNLRILSADIEAMLRETESLHAILGVFGRPYVNWDVYPVWELEEAWRELLSAQHHDNDECEGLCGHVGKASYKRAMTLAREQWKRAREMFFLRVATDTSSSIPLNANGFSIHAKFEDKTEEVPSFGFRVMRGEPSCDTPLLFQMQEDQTLVVKEGKLAIYPIAAMVQGQRAPWNVVTTQDGEMESKVLRAGDQSGSFAQQALLNATLVHWRSVLTKPDGGLNAAQRVKFEFDGQIEIWADHPYGVSQVVTGQKGRKKYPTGDWMTSPQWFEEIERAFSASSFVRVKQGHEEWVISHQGCRQWFFAETAIECVTTAYDPWDEHFFVEDVRSSWRIARCEGWTMSDCLKWATTHRHSDVSAVSFSTKPIVGDIPLTYFSFAQIEPSNVLMTALYREAEGHSGHGLEHYAGRGMGYPYVLRLVEYDGLDSEVDLTIVGPIAKAYKTNLMGEIESEIVPCRTDDGRLTRNPAELAKFGIEAASLKFKMRAHEIATLYLDIVPGRKQTRDLDSKREIWATVHRQDQG